MEKLDRVTHPKPEEDFILATFEIFERHHPWVGDEDVHPKSVAREMFEGARGFREYVRELSVARSEGVLLRYLSQVHNTLVKSVPSAARTDEVFDAVAYLHTELSGIDSSLMEAWEALLAPAAPAGARGAPEAAPFDLAQEPRIFAARVRAELHGLVRALAAGDYEEAASAVRQSAEDPWDAARFERTLAPFFEDYERIRFDPDARRAHRTRLVETSPRSWDVWQVLADPQGDDMWAVEGEIDLAGQRDPEGPLVRVRRIGT